MKEEGICPLCRQQKALVESHLIPAGVSRSLQREEGGNLPPISITATITLQTSRQFKDWVFCADCEQLLNRNGESWVLANMARPQDFPLFEALEKIPPSVEYEDGYGFETDGVSGIDADKLAYFGLSMFWRTSVNDWLGVDGYHRRLELGSYQEPIRQFLLGTGPFPKNVALLISVWPRKDSVLKGTYLPRLNRKKDYHIFTFYLPGITFIMCAGKKIDPGIRELCCYTSPGRTVFVSSDVASQNVKLLEGLSKITRLSKSLQERLGDIRFRTR